MAMEYPQIIWRIGFWVGAVIIITLSVWDIKSHGIFSKRESLRTRVFVWCVILAFFTIACIVFGSPGLITYGQTWWVRGQILDQETKQPLEGAHVVLTCYRPGPEYADWINEKFIALEALSKSDEKTSRTLPHGVTDREGNFLCKVSYFSGEIPFGYPLWGSVGKKNVWILIRKEGYPSPVIRLTTAGWLESERDLEEPEESKINDVHLLYVLRDQRNK